MTKQDKAKQLIEQIRSECRYLEQEMNHQCDTLENALDFDLSTNKEEWDDAVGETVDGCNSGLGGQIGLINEYITELSDLVHEIDQEIEEVA